MTKDIERLQFEIQKETVNIENRSEEIEKISQGISKIDNTLVSLLTLITILYINLGNKQKHALPN